MSLRVLAISDAYSPGFRGGTTQHLINIVASLGRRLAFHVLTRDRDVGAGHAYDRPLDVWTDQDGAHVYYASPRGLRPRALASAVIEARAEVWLMNSVFSRLAIRTLLLARVGAVPRVPILLSPEGEFHPGALAQRGGRKRAYLAVARVAGLWRDVTWRATGGEEADQIRAIAGTRARIVLAPVMAPARLAAPAPADKHPGHLRLAYVSRVTPKKNLLFLIELLAARPLPIDLEIVGPIDDASYGARCREAASRVPAPARIHWVGEVPPGEVPAYFARAHASVLPTLGENFGLAVLESLAAGRPVLVSTHTPWRGLAAREAGWDIDLTDTAAWVRTLEELVAMDAASHARWTRGARAAAEAHHAADAAPAQLEHALRALAKGGH